MHTVSYVEMNHRTSKNMACIVKCNSYIRSNICDFLKVKSDCMFNHFLNIITCIYWLFSFHPHNLNKVKLKQSHDIPCRLSAVYRPSVTVLEKERDNC